ncbi:MAG TPA: DUF5686 and carboxypeptidase regulatory-like domain-containing protein [Ferruginibacter sp.]|jgi:hypothetical protein|nr:DUF5686 and carboxypeptidase regulatory-like domain-containing protein [Ferruginibacter sp.]
MRKFLVLIFIGISFHSSSQKIYGVVYNATGDLLPYASVNIKGTTIGGSANNKARFSFTVSPGNYTVVCQYIGFVAQEKNVTITDSTTEELVFILKQQKLELEEVVVKAGEEDPAYEIIRQAIKKRAYYNKQVKAFACDLYTKNMIKLRHLPDKILGQKIPEGDRAQMRLDSAGQGIIYLSESMGKISSQQPNKLKVEIKKSRVSGSGNFGFTFPTFINFYQNNVSIFNGRLNPRGFISPIADGATRFYRYKYLGSFWEDGKEINSIRVTPRRNYEPLFSGVINITENDWRIHSVDLSLTAKQSLDFLDTLHITQFFVPVNKDVWQIKNQLLHFDFQKFAIDAIGNFLTVYSKYTIDPKFPPNFFNNIVIKYDTGVTKNPATYWDSTRPVPLEKEEVKDYEVKDSLFEIEKDSPVTKATIDSLRKREGSFKFYKMFFYGIDRMHYSQTFTYKWGLDPLVQKMEYNLAEGIVVNLNGHFSHYLKSIKSNLIIDPVIRYGFNNTHLNAWTDVIFKTKDFLDGKMERETWSFAGGKRVSQFNKDCPITPDVNTISTLLSGKDFMKTYENYFGSIGFSKIFNNGLHAGINALYEDRIPLNNTTNFIFRQQDTVHITPNFPDEKIATQFTRYQAFIVTLDCSFQPGQKYIQFPNGKVSLGSKYPTFSVEYTKGINTIFGSDVNFDKWNFAVKNDINFKLAGLVKYKFVIGGFLNTRSVFIQDYDHINGNEYFAASEYLNSFQLADYYTYSNTASFFSEGHIEYHLNGLLTNKIPLFNRYNWNLVVGSNAFYINRDGNYTEVFVGLENFLHIFRIDVVASYADGKTAETGLRLGTQGLLGGQNKFRRQDNPLKF